MVFTPIFGGNSVTAGGERHFPCLAFSSTRTLTLYQVFRQFMSPKVTGQFVHFCNIFQCLILVMEVSQILAKHIYDFHGILTVFGGFVELGWLQDLGSHNLRCYYTELWFSKIIQ